MKVAIIALFFLPPLAQGQGDSANKSTVWTFENGGKSYFCTAEQPVPDSPTIHIENMSSLGLNRQNTCYKCCVMDLDRDTCHQTPYKASYGLAARGKSCGCKDVN